ncbi:hypothetical protein HQ585_03415 [candidate division KSB1 bacterium]|nr:hypothetical protein [candidate division KSB1 bacterium]
MHNKWVTSCFVRVALILSSVLLHAEEDGFAGRAGSYLKMGIGADLMAMGGEGVAWVKDAHVTYSNPAGLVFLEKKSISATLVSMALDRRVQFVGFALPLGQGNARKPGQLQGGFALGWLSSGVDQIDGRDFNGIHTDNFSFGEHTFFFSFALKPSSIVGIGFSGKLHYSRIPGLIEDGSALSATGFGFDVGMLIRPHPTIQAGLCIRDMRSKYTWDSKKYYEQYYSEGGSQSYDVFPRTLAVGIVWQPIHLASLNLNVQKIDAMDVVETSKVAFTLMRYAGGIQLNLHPAAVIRFGYQEKGLTFGGGTRFQMFHQLVGLNYAFVSDPIAPRGNHVFSWTLQF